VLQWVKVLQNFIAEKLPNDGTLVPKHVVGFGARYEVYFVICFVVFKPANFVGFQKYRTQKKKFTKWTALNSLTW
jgi:hypothetical protein